MSNLAKFLASRSSPENGAKAANAASPGADVSPISPISSEKRAEEQFHEQLEQRIRSMAQRWCYSRDDLAEVIALSRTDPVAWLKAVELDEKRDADFRRHGLLPRCDG